MVEKNQQRQEINWLKLILAFLIATFMFTFGLFLGFIARSFIETTSINMENEIRNQIVSLETIALLEKNYPCSDYAVDVASQKLDYLGGLITLLENKKGKKDKDVLELKKFYSIFEARHMLLMKERNDQCKGDYDLILFFYSNSLECEGEVEKAHFVVSYLRNKYDFVRVYSFDIDLDSDIVSFLKKKYDIKGCSGVVINEGKFQGKVERADQIEHLVSGK